MPISDFKFHHRIRVRYGEIDGQNVVFNARYLDYADIAVTEYWRATGFKAATEYAEAHFHVARAEVDFRKPIFFDEEIDLYCRTSAFGRTSMTTLVEIHGVGQDGDGGEDLRAAIKLVNVHVDLDTHRPTPLPDVVREVFGGFEEMEYDGHGL